ncbi:MAG: rRNA maturation RNase YbeY, partial [Bacteroidia bacterium]|nr:rRNA maturation RNase YbeY [Bacteroidia bacterium]
LNQKYLNHDTLTDVIGFDYSVGKKLQGDIYISLDRVRENAKIFEVEFDKELSRVMIHGLLHFCGWTDDSPDEKESMRRQENIYLEARLHN